MVIFIITIAIIISITIIFINIMAAMIIIKFTLSKRLYQLTFHISITYINKIPVQIDEDYKP